ncbi:MAG TPA: hypothetical protein VJ596_02950, partial [Gemmatimonadaceae bacterium]|nr:hypothetical protein [Gemmatimonadaceae bacterium]
SALSRDLALANQDTAAQPQLQDVPANPPAAAAPAPKQTTPARTPSRTTTPPRQPTTRPSTPTTTPSGNTVASGAKGSEGATASIAAGTTINLTSGDRVCTNTHRAGDRFTATVTEAVVGPNGATIPAGARAVVQVSSVKRSENANDPIQMGFVVQSVSWGGKTYPIDASITDVQVDRVRASSTGNDAKKVVGGAVAGAIIGQILGKDTKSTVIGAATGAAAGTAVAMGTADYEGCVPQGGRIQVRLNSPATIQAD